MNTKYFLILLVVPILLVACGQSVKNQREVIFIYDDPINGWNVQIAYEEDTARADAAYALSKGYAKIELSNENQTYTFSTPFDISYDLYIDDNFNALSVKEKRARLFAQDSLHLSYVNVNFNDSMLLTNQLPIEKRNLLYFADFDFDGEDELLIPYKDGYWSYLKNSYYLLEITPTKILPYTNNETVFDEWGTQMYFFPQDTTIITSYRGENFVIYKGDGKGIFYCKRCLSDTRYSDTIGIYEYNKNNIPIDSCITANPWRWTYETYSEYSPYFGDITFEEMIKLPYQRIKSRCDSILNKRNACWFDNCLKDGIVCFTTVPLRLHLQNDTLRKFSEYDLDIEYPIAAKSREDACFVEYNEALDSIVGKECLLEMPAQALATLQKEFMRVLIEHVNYGDRTNYAVGGSVEKAQKALERMFLDEIKHNIQVSIAQDPGVTEHWVDVRKAKVYIVERTDEMVENDIITFGLRFYEGIEHRSYTNWYYFSFDVKTGKLITTYEP